MCSRQKAEAFLETWGKQIDRAVVGNKWHKRRQDEGCEWVAFLEGQRSEHHWHVLFRLSPHLRDTRTSYIADNLTHRHGTGPRGRELWGLPWAIHKEWKTITGTGDAVTRLISSSGVIDYATKGMLFPDSIDAYTFSPAFTRR